MHSYLNHHAIWTMILDNDKGLCGSRMYCTYMNTTWGGANVLIVSFQSFSNISLLNYTLILFYILSECFLIHYM